MAVFGLARAFQTLAVAAAGMLAVCSSALVAAPRGRSEASLTRQIDNIVMDGRRELDLPGVSIAIMRGNRLVLSKGYGWAVLDKRIAASAETIYPVGSLSKQFTAAAVMTLVDRDLVSLDEPITRYVPEYRPVGVVPTVRQLLQQSSGIPTWDDLPELQDESDLGKFSLTKVATALSNHPVMYPPGDWWSYSNSNYTLLARLIERVTGTPYDQYMQGALFGPLGLRSTSGCRARAAGWAGGANFAAGYIEINGKFLPRPMRPAISIAMSGAGGLCSNALDLVRWTRKLVTGRAVGLRSFKQMIRPTSVRAGFVAPYGFGVSLLPFAGQRAVWHTGVMAGYISVLVYLPGSDITIAALTNSRHVWLHSIVKRLALAMIHAKPPLVRDQPIPQSEIARSVGVYNDYMFNFRVYREGQQLFVKVDQLGSSLRLRYQGGHDYVTAEPESFRFHFGPLDGPTKRVDWEWTELRAFARKVS